MSTLEWINAHLPEGGFIAAGFVLLKWLLGREIRRVDRNQEDHEERLRKLEESKITRSNLDELRMSLMATITGSHEMLQHRINDLRDGISTLTDHLLGKK